MKRTLIFVFSILMIFTAYTKDFEIDMINGEYTGIYFDINSDETISFDISSDTSIYDLNISLYTYNGNYLCTIYNGERPDASNEYKVNWNGKPDGFNKIKPGLYLLYFEKKGERPLKFVLPLLVLYRLGK